MPFLKHALKFSFRGIKARWDAGGGRIVLGDNIGGEGVALRSNCSISDLKRFIFYMRTALRAL